MFCILWSILAHGNIGKRCLLLWFSLIEIQTHRTTHSATRWPLVPLSCRQCVHSLWSQCEVGVGCWMELDVGTWSTNEGVRGDFWELVRKLRVNKTRVLWPVSSWHGFALGIWSQVLPTVANRCGFCFRLPIICYYYLGDVSKPRLSLWLYLAWTNVALHSWLYKPKRIQPCPFVTVYNMNSSELS